MRDIRGALIASLVLAAGFGAGPAPADPIRTHTDSGDVVMAAIATGMISSIIVNSNDHRDYGHR